MKIRSFVVLLSDVPATIQRLKDSGCTIIQDQSDISLGYFTIIEPKETK